MIGSQVKEAETEDEEEKDMVGQPDTSYMFYKEEEELDGRHGRIEMFFGAAREKKHKKSVSRKCQVNGNSSYPIEEGSYSAIYEVDLDNEVDDLERLEICLLLVYRPILKEKIRTSRL